jgi:hypothetical protein
LKVELAEWPGESPVSIRVKANESQRRALGNDARYIPLGAVDKRMPSMAVLGWGQWRLEVVHDGTYTGRGAEIFARKRGESLLRAGYGPRSTRR